VQISGVTGDVLDMGLLQFQLSQFDVDKQCYTGQIATFSNSLIFVSPATGLLKFDGKIASGGSSKGAIPDAKEHGLSARREFTALNVRLAIKALELVMKLRPSASLPGANVCTCTFHSAFSKLGSVQIACHSHR
jgi:hypothetical protein